MTNNSSKTQPQLMTLDQITALKRDDLRKYATQLGIKSAAKYTRTDLTALVLQKIAELTPAADEKKTERVRTSHADCKHASTKVARAKCRRERARKNV